MPQRAARAPARPGSRVGACLQTRITAVSSFTVTPTSCAAGRPSAMSRTVGLRTSRLAQRRESGGRTRCTRSTGRPAPPDRYVARRASGRAVDGDPHRPSPRSTGTEGPACGACDRWRAPRRGLRASAWGGRDCRTRPQPEGPRKRFASSDLNEPVNEVGSRGSPRSRRTGHAQIEEHPERSDRQGERLSARFLVR